MALHWVTKAHKGGFFGSVGRAIGGIGNALTGGLFGSIFGSGGGNDAAVQAQIAEQQRLLQQQQADLDARRQAVWNANQQADALNVKRAQQSQQSYLAGYDESTPLGKRTLLGSGT